MGTPSAAAQLKEAPAVSDVESVTAWLKADAPVESVKPWAPVETNLPDPELLPLSPGLCRLAECLNWARASPLGFATHLLAWATLLTALIAALAPLALSESERCVKGFVVRCVNAWACVVAFSSTRARLLLYRHALKYQVSKGASLADVTTFRLRYRRARCAQLAPLCVVATYLTYLSLSGDARDTGPPLCAGRCCRTASTELWFAAQARATALAVVLVYLVTYRLHRDPVEEVDLRRRANAGHVHTSS